MNYLELSRTSSVSAGARLRVALDVLERASRSAPAGAAVEPRVTVRDLSIGQHGEPILGRFGSPAQLATLLWEILALQVAPTDDLPWSDPAEDLPADVLDALASLTVRPASTVKDLRDRFASALAAHASSRTDVVAALRGELPAKVVHLHTPVVPRDPSRITLPAPANTVQALRTLSATGLGLGPSSSAAPATQGSARPVRAAVLPAPPPPRPAKPAQPVRSVLARVPQRPKSRALPDDVERPLLSDIAMKVEPRAPARASAEEAPNPGAITVAMAAMALPASARRSEPPRAVERLLEPSPVADEPPTMMLEEPSDAGVQLDVRPAERDALPAETGTGPVRGTLDPWMAVDESNDRQPEHRRRRMWPLVAASLAAALALIAFASHRSSSKEMARDVAAVESSSPATPPEAALPTAQAESVAADASAEAAPTAASTATSVSSAASKAGASTSLAKSPARVAAPGRVALPPRQGAAPTVDTPAAETAGPSDAAVPAAPPASPPPEPAAAPALEPAPLDPSAGY